MDPRAFLDMIITEVRAGEPDTTGPSLRAIRMPALRPYLPTTAMLGQLCTACWHGSIEIVRLTWRWCRAAPLGDRWIRGLAPAGTVALAVEAVRWQPAPAVIALAVAWLTAAAALAPKPPTAKIISAGGAAPTSPTPTPPQPERAPLDIGTVADVVHQIATPRGWKGAHLDDVLALLPGRSRGELLDVLATAGIPVENQLKLTLPGGRQRNRQGIRLSTLPTAPVGPAAPTPQPDPAAGPEPAPPAATVTVHGGQ